MVSFHFLSYLLVVRILVARGASEMRGRLRLGAVPLLLRVYLSGIRAVEVAPLPTRLGSRWHREAQEETVGWILGLPVK